MFKQDDGRVSKIAGERRDPFPQGTYLVTVGTVVHQRTRAKGQLWKATYACAADLIADQQKAMEPGVRGEHAMFPMKTGEMDYVLRDPVSLFGTGIALELGLEAPLGQDRFVPETEQLEGRQGQPGAWPADPQATAKRAEWLKVAQDGKGRYALAELVAACFCTHHIMQLTVSGFTPKGGKEGQDIFTTHEYTVPSKKRMGWYRQHYLGEGAADSDPGT